MTKLLMQVNLNIYIDYNKCIKDYYKKTNNLNIDLLINENLLILKNIIVKFYKMKYDAKRIKKELEKIKEFKQIKKYIIDIDRIINNTILNYLLKK